MKLNSNKKLNALKLFLLVICLPVGLAALVNFVIIPHNSKSNANQRLRALIANEGNISGYNSSSVKYSGARIKGSVKNQQALSLGSSASTPGEFVFTNGKPVSNSNSNILTVYLDFSTRQSQEFSLIEQNYIKSLVDFGRAKLVVYAVPSSSSYSIYAPELLAETFAHDPSAAWKVFVSTMQFSTELTNNPESNNSIVNQLVKIAQRAGVTSVTRRSILGGEYTSWILASSQNRAIQNANLPLVELNGQEISITAHTFYAQDGLEKYVEAHLLSSK